MTAPSINLTEQKRTIGVVLALGTSPRGDIARVFLGSRGLKIMRHSPVPVLVLPG